MGILKNKIDFVALVSVERANPNGDPLGGNRPRTDLNGYGEISDVCIKRKMRNRMQDLGQSIFVQSAERADDGFGSLSERANAALDGMAKDADKASELCKKWIDVRTFGQVFAYKGKGGKGDGVSIGVRGPVSLHQAVSVSPVDIESLQITKSVNGEPTKDGKKASDTMGTKHMVHYGLYVIKGAINVQLAEKTGFTEEDATIVKECLSSLFANDSSAARPEGSMEVRELYWFKHNCKDGQYSSAKVHRSIKIAQKDPSKLPDCFEDYDVTREELPGLEPEIIYGL